MATKEQKLEHLELLKLHRDNALDCMEGEDAEGFARFEKVFNCYQTLVEDLEEEIKKDGDRAEGKDLLLKKEKYMKQKTNNPNILVQFVSKERRSLKITFWKPRTKYVLACVSKAMKTKEGTFEDKKIYLFKEELIELGNLIREAIEGWPDSQGSDNSEGQQELSAIPTVNTNTDDIPF